MCRGAASDEQTARIIRQLDAKRVCAHPSKPNLIECPGLKEPRDNRFFPVAPPRFTSKTGKCAFWSRFLDWRPNDTGGFHRHKGQKSADLCPSDSRAHQDELALEGFPGVPKSVRLCHLVFDITLCRFGGPRRDTQLDHRTRLYAAGEIMPDSVSTSSAVAINVHGGCRRPSSIGWECRYAGRRRCGRLK
jgi:hypothetical protein